MNAVDIFFAGKEANSFQPFGLTKQEASELLRLALLAREKAYAPYSSFQVGAAILTANGLYFSGSNVENASYGATICAERSAIVKAVNDGHKIIKAVAVIADYHEPIPPCGNCRQVISEFCKEAVVIMANTSGSIQYSMFSTLFPSIFVLSKVG